MRLRPSNSLTILLILAAVFPPGAVVNLWIAGASLHHPADARKSVQARARNRIGSSIQVEACRACSPLASGEKKPRGPSLAFLREERPSSKLLGQASRSPSFPAILRLRC